MEELKSLSPVRVGVVGLGFGGESAVKAYRQIPGVEVRALAGQEQERLAWLGRTYEIPHLYHDYEELLARDDLDAVSVAVPNFLHAPVATAALKRGLHVLCEKPLSRTLEEAEAMVKAASEARRVLRVVFNYRERGDVRVLKQAIDEGRLGKIYYAKAYWMRRRGIPGAGTWFVNKEKAGGGPLIDLGTHVLDLALYLLGEPEVTAVTAATYSELGQRGWGVDLRSKKTGSGNPFDVEDLATAFLRLSTGGTLLLESSWATHSSAQDDFGLVLYGVEGGAEIRVRNYEFGDTLRIYTDVAGVPSEITPSVGHGEHHLGVIREFIQIIRNGNWSAHNGIEALKRTRITEACYSSARQGQEVRLDEEEDTHLKSSIA